MPTTTQTQSLQLVFLDRLVLMLQALKTERVIKEFYYTPRAITQAAEFPFAFFRLAADRDYLPDDTLGPPVRFRVEARTMLSLCIKRTSTYAARELAELIDIFRRRILTDIPGECAITIDGVGIINDPLVANLYDEFAAATIAVDYSGLDQY